MNQNTNDTRSQIGDAVSRIQLEMNNNDPAALMHTSPENIWAVVRSLLRDKEILQALASPAAQAQPVAEWVGTMRGDGRHVEIEWHRPMTTLPVGTKIYTHPAPEALAPDAADGETKQEAAIWKLIHQHARDLHAVDYWSGMCTSSVKLNRAYASSDALRKALRSALAAHPVAGEVPTYGALVEAVDNVLADADCECPNSMRHDRGEHLSGCFLFDLNIERQQIAAPPAKSEAVAGFKFVVNDAVPDGWVVVDTHGVIHRTVERRHHFFGDIQDREVPDIESLAGEARTWGGLAPFTLHPFYIGPAIVSGASDSEGGEL